MNLTGQPIWQKGQKAIIQPKAFKDMTEAAEGEECQLRLEVCNHDPSTTVFVHYRFFGWAGVGEKPPNFLGAFGCSACHEELDARGKGLREGAEWGFEDLLRAMGNTLIRLRAKGYLIEARDLKNLPHD